MIDIRHWRIGTHYGIHGYAENPGPGDDEPIFTAMNKTIANQIIVDHNGQNQFRTEIVHLLQENRDLKAELEKARGQIAKLQANAFRAVGTARRAHNVLRELLHDQHTASTPDTADAEAACE
ncbi:hypothetical protein [Amycolatopsis kentuckyensis]|uniref:hypothetical protein n=1 Tax=Amycolatopsis kentuckyensis TaxID=218823 RepID=UPI0035624805